MIDRRTKPNRETSIRVMIREFQRQKWMVLFVVLLMALGAGMTLLQPLFFKMLFDTAIPQQDHALVGWLILGMLLAPLCAMGLTYFQEYLRVNIGECVSLALRKEAFDHLIAVRIGEAERFTPGDLMFRLTRCPAENASALPLHAH